jgi:hypothetical protein
MERSLIKLVKKRNSLYSNRKYRKGEDIQRQIDIILKEGFDNHINQIKGV